MKPCDLLANIDGAIYVFQPLGSSPDLCGLDVCVRLRSYVFDTNGDLCGILIPVRVLDDPAPYISRAHAAKIQPNHAARVDLHGGVIARYILNHRGEIIDE